MSPPTRLCDKRHKLIRQGMRIPVPHECAFRLIYVHASKDFHSRVDKLALVRPPWEEAYWRNHRLRYIKNKGRPQSILVECIMHPISAGYYSGDLNWICGNWSHKELRWWADEAMDRSPNHPSQTSHFPREGFSSHEFRIYARACVAYEFQRR